MTNRHQALIDGFEDKLHTLVQLHRKEKEANRLLTEELRRKEEDLMQAHKAILELRSDYENLKLAYALGEDDDGREIVHQRISQLVREIDKCIDLLNQ
jgi:hypothetical protein